MSLSRRTFLAAGAGLVVAACGADGNSANPGAGSVRPDTAAGDVGGSTGGQVIVRFFPDGILAAGQPQRLPIGLGDGNGVVTSGGPERLRARVTDGSGTTVAEVEAARHADRLPRPYWPFTLQLAAPGVYTLAVETEDGTATTAFTITDPAAVVIPRPGDAMVPVDTPTTADRHGVDPICTREPACPLHDITLAAALAARRPVAFLVATPAFCQTAACGPVLDVLLGQRDASPTITMVHAEVYTDTTIDTTSPAVVAYRLAFEPVLYLAGADGVVRERMDSIFDATEVRAALTRLEGS